MAEAIRDVVITGLRNAHALEAQAIQILERQIPRTTDYPALHAKLQQHAIESRDQQTKLEGLLEHLGGSTSTVKQAVMGAMGNMAALMHTVAEDEILKNLYANYAFEHFEIAAYKSLIAMARQGGLAAVEPVLQGILKQEEATAAWLGQNIEAITQQYLAKEGHLAAAVAA